MKDNIYYFKVADYCSYTCAKLKFGAPPPPLAFGVVNGHKLEIRFTRDTEYPDPDVNPLRRSQASSVGDVCGLLAHMLRTYDVTSLRWSGLVKVG